MNQRHANYPSLIPYMSTRVGGIDASFNPFGFVERGESLDAFLLRFDI